jgi:hypothetical protein
MLAFKPLSLMSMAAGMIGSYWYATHGMPGDGRFTSFWRSLRERFQRDREDFESGEYVKWGEREDDDF